LNDLRKESIKGWPEETFWTVFISVVFFALVPILSRLQSFESKVKSAASKILKTGSADEIEVVV
jgi:hypothetical protein